MPTNVLVTGANRGLGKAFIEIYAARDDYTVVAAVRDPSDASSKALTQLPTGKNSTVIVVKIESTKQEDAASAIKQIQTANGINHLDLVIANAGIAAKFPSVEDVKLEDISRHMSVNVYGTICLYQATLPLLRRAKGPKFVSIGSVAGVMTDMALVPVPNAAYGPSKAALHWITAKMHFEEPNLIAFPLHPGFVKTDMGNQGAVAVGLESADITVEESLNGMIPLIDAATKDVHSGKLWTWEGKQFAF